MKILKWTGLGLFAFYWACTFFFNMPDNYLTISATHGERVFTSLFYQQWSFFAPPPKSSNRLYYTFAAEDTTDMVVTEVLAPLQKIRRQKFIFNDAESMQDDLLSGSVNVFSDFLISEFDYHKNNGCEGSSNEEECYRNFLRDKNEEFLETRSITTLTRYGKLLAAKQRKATGEKRAYMRLTIAQAPIPKFADRNKTDLPTPEEDIVWFSDS